MARFTSRGNTKSVWLDGFCTIFSLRGIQERLTWVWDWLFRRISPFALDRPRGIWRSRGNILLIEVVVMMKICWRLVSLRVMLGRRNQRVSWKIFNVYSESGAWGHGGWGAVPRAMDSFESVLKPWCFKREKDHFALLVLLLGFLESQGSGFFGSAKVGLCSGCGLKGQPMAEGNDIATAIFNFKFRSHLDGTLTSGMGSLRKAFVSILISSRTFTHLSHLVVYRLYNFPRSYFKSTMVSRSSVVQGTTSCQRHLSACELMPHDGRSFSYSRERKCKDRWLLYFYFKVPHVQLIVSKVHVINSDTDTCLRGDWLLTTRSKSATCDRTSIE